MPPDAGAPSFAAAAAPVGIATIVIIVVVVEVYTVDSVRWGALLRRGSLGITPGKRAGEGEERSVRRRFILYTTGMGKRSANDRTMTGMVDVHCQNS